MKNVSKKELELEIDMFAESFFSKKQNKEDDSSHILDDMERAYKGESIRNAEAIIGYTRKCIDEHSFEFSFYRKIDSTEKKSYVSQKNAASEFFALILVRCGIKDVRTKTEEILDTSSVFCLSEDILGGERFLNVLKKGERDSLLIQWFSSLLDHYNAETGLNLSFYAFVQVLWRTIEKKQLVLLPTFLFELQKKTRILCKKILPALHLGVSDIEDFEKEDNEERVELFASDIKKLLSLIASRITFSEESKERDERYLSLYAGKDFESCVKENGKVNTSPNHKKPFVCKNGDFIRSSGYLSGIGRVFGLRSIGPQLAKWEELARGQGVDISRCMQEYKDSCPPVIVKPSFLSQTSDQATNVPKESSTIDLFSKKSVEEKNKSFHVCDNKEESPKAMHRRFLQELFTCFFPDVHGFFLSRLFFRCQYVYGYAKQMAAPFSFEFNDVDKGNIGTFLVEESFILDDDMLEKIQSIHSFYIQFQKDISSSISAAEHHTMLLEKGMSTCSNGKNFIRFFDKNISFMNNKELLFFCTVFLMKYLPSSREELGILLLSEEKKQTVEVERAFSLQHFLAGNLLEMLSYRNMFQYIRKIHEKGGRDILNRKIIPQGYLF